MVGAIFIAVAREVGVVIATVIVVVAIVAGVVVAGTGTGVICSVDVAAVRIAGWLAALAAVNPAAVEVAAAAAAVVVVAAAAAAAAAIFVINVSTLEVTAFDAAVARGLAAARAVERVAA